MSGELRYSAIALLLALAPAQAATYTFTQYVTGVGGLGGASVATTITQYHLGSHEPVARDTLAAEGFRDYDPIHGLTTFLYGDGQSISFTVLDDTDYFITTRDAHSFGASLAYTIILTTPLPAAAALFALGLAILSIRRRPA